MSPGGKIAISFPVNAEQGSQQMKFSCGMDWKPHSLLSSGALLTLPPLWIVNIKKMFVCVCVNTGLELYDYLL